ncbi:MAG TPA: hypothetical protein P5110_00315 [Candidatus Omnitrophota bacterium]|nr:hypothetical protein [Candidatus Omnitrophota bacterium]
MTEKPRSDVIYALADYKQLVLAYRTKYAELVQSLAFWRTTAIWLGALLFCFIAAVVAIKTEADRGAADARKDTLALRRQLQALSEKLDTAEQSLGTARHELSKRDTVIHQLEKNLSTASKKMVEELLQDNQETAK